MRLADSGPRHRAARPAPLRSMLTVTSAVAGATLIGLGAAGTTLALWEDSDPLNASLVKAGSMSLTVENQSGMYQLAGDWKQMLPGDRFTHEVEVATPGTVDTTITATANASSNFTVRVQKGACSSDPLELTLPSLGTWTANESSLVCIEVTLASTAVEGATEDVVVDFA